MGERQLFGLSKMAVIIETKDFVDCLPPRYLEVLLNKVGGKPPTLPHNYTTSLISTLADRMLPMNRAE